MRTLKKVLALSMVFAMAFSMMAGAAFNDQDKIDASLTEDIQLLTALEVFQGDEKGDFNPTDNVTRAQAAKMIYVLKNNGQDDEAAAFKGTSVYSDVPSGHWAEGYINYATNLGIMNGWTEGSVRKFDPNGNVTGIELTKMLLCMIGYRSDIQGYTGNGWQTNVLRDGATSAITTNYLPTIYNAAPRQWTARLMANAINAPYVTYSRGEVVMGHATDATRSYGRQYLGLVMAEGYLKNAGKVSLDLSASETVLDDDGDRIVIAENKNLTGDTSVFKTTVDPMLLGQHVKVYYKSGTTTTYEAKVYAVLTTGDSKVYDVTRGDVTIDKSAGNAYETIKFNGYNGGSAKRYENVAAAGDTPVGRGITLVENLSKVTPLRANLTQDTSSNPSDASKDKNFAKLGNNSSEAIRFVDQDNDGFIDLAFTNDVTYAIVSSHNASRNSIRFENADGRALNTLVDGEVVNSESAYKKINFVNDVVADDVVSVTLNVTSGNKVWDIAKIEPQNTTVSGYSLNNDGTYANVTINGESTKFATNAVAGYSLVPNNSTIANDTSFYTDGKFIVYSKGGTGVTSVNDLAYIIGMQDYESYGKTTWYAKVLLSDGTQSEYQVNKYYDSNDDEISIPAEGLADGTVLSYNISNNKINLYQLKGDKNVHFATGAQEYDEDAKNVKVTNGSANANGTYRLGDEAYFFVKSKANTADPKYNVIKASELGNRGIVSTAVRAFAYRTVNGMPTIQFGVLETNSSAVSTKAEYAFMKSRASYNVVDGEYVVQATVVLPNGEETTLKQTSTSQGTANTTIAAWNGLRGKVVTYELDIDGEVDGSITKVTVAPSTAISNENDTWNKIVILGWGGTTASVSTDWNSTSKEVAGSTIVNVASDVKIHVVDATSESYAQLVSDNDHVELTANVEEENGTVHDDQYVGYSAYAVIDVVNGQNTITDIFVEQDGAAIDKIW